MRNLKRVFCLFLVFAMLVPYAYAVADPIGGGVGNAQAGSGGSDPNSPFATNTNEDVYGAGLMISVETPSGITLGYEDDPSNPDNPRKISEADKKAFYEYYTSHFPQTDPDHNEYGMYLIPTNYYDRHDQRSQSYIRGAPGNRNDVKGFDLGEQQLRMQSPSNSVNNVGGKAAWNAAYQNMQSNPARPNPYLDDGYWITYIKNLSRDEAEKRISQIFSSSNPSVGYNASNDADDLPNRVYAYLGFSGDTNNFASLGADNPYYDTALFMNYCSFLADAIKCMPAEKQDALAKKLDSMSATFMKGEPWAPMVVTSEIIVPSICWVNELRFWWAPRQSIATIRKSTVNVSVNPSTTEGGVIDQLFSGSFDTAAGGLNMYGDPKQVPNWTPYSGKGFKLPLFGTLLESIDQGLLDSVGSSYKAIEGFAVWGVSAEYVPNPAPPQTSEAGVTPQGSISIAVEPVEQIKDVGG